MKNIVSLAKSVETKQAAADKANEAAEKANAELAQAKEALAAAVNGTSTPTRQKSRKTVAAPTAKAGKTKGRKARASVNHDAVVADLKSGMTAKAVAEKNGCAIPTVNLIKQKAGLTKSRAK